MDVDKMLAPLRRTLEHWPERVSDHKIAEIATAIGCHPMLEWQLKLAPGDFFATYLDSGNKRESMCVVVFRVESRDWKLVLKIHGFDEEPVPAEDYLGLSAKCVSAEHDGLDVFYPWDAHVRLSSSQVDYLARKGFPDHPSDFTAALLEHAMGVGDTESLNAAKVDDIERILGGAMIWLIKNNIPVEFVTLTERLSRTGQLDVIGGVSAMEDILRTTVPVAEGGEKPKRAARPRKAAV